jgi:cytochrome P450
MELIPMFTDPPEHTLYRQFMTPVLSPVAVARWEQFTREHARSCVNAVAADGACDFVASLARPLPLAVFGMFMGLGAAQIAPLEELVKRADDVNNSAEVGTQAVMAMGAALGDIIEERIATSDAGDDLPRRLARTSIDGRKLTSRELLNI